MIEDKNIWATEIKLLESLIGMDAESDDFKRVESELSDRGKEERDKLEAQYERIIKEKAEKARKKQEKENKKLSKEPEKGQRSVKDMFAPKGNAKVNGAKGKKSSKVKKEASAGNESSELSELSDGDLS